MVYGTNTVSNVYDSRLMCKLCKKAAFSEQLKGITPICLYIKIHVPVKRQERISQEIIASLTVHPVLW